MAHKSKGRPPLVSTQLKIRVVLLEKHVAGKKSSLEIPVMRIMRMKTHSDA